jgi:acylphosphatase
VLLEGANRTGYNPGLPAGVLGNVIDLDRGEPAVCASNEPRERREIHFTGRVQGVGFRYTTRAIAARYDVGGFVENLRDGRVLLVVESAAGVLDEFVGAVQAEMAGYVTHTRTEIFPASGEFTAFEVRH